VRTDGAGRLEEARAAIRHANEHDTYLAGLLAQVERERAYVAEGCSTVVHWAVQQGFDEQRARSLASAGRGFAVAPEAEQAVLDGEITPQKAGVVGRFVKPTPALESKTPPDAQQLADEEQRARERVLSFVDHAKETPRHRLVRDVNAEQERVQQGERVVPLHFEVKERVRDGWRLVRKIAARQAGRSLTEGEAFEFVTDDFLARHDKDGLSGHRSERKRRMGPTCEHPEQRHWPAEVERAAKRRAVGHCEYPGCTNGTYLQLCHIRGHARGGARELRNVVLLCTHHHTELDKGRIRFLERTARGVAFVLVATGEVIEPDPGRRGADILPERRWPDVDADAEAPPDRVAERPPAWNRDALRQRRRSGHDPPGEPAAA
jgi:hypothetical protein